MGKNGRNAVREQTIEHVTADLLAWYELGMQRHRSKSFRNRLISYLLMLFFVPVSILSFFVYDILVSFFCGGN